MLGVDCGRFNNLFKDEQVPMHQMVCVDEDGDLILTRRHAHHCKYSQISLSLLDLLLVSYYWIYIGLAVQVVIRL
jgi:hypothetical protein